MADGCSLNPDRIAREGREPAAVRLTAGGSAYRPIGFGMGADPGHHEHRSPSTSVPAEASG
jgi:hypothetical protein